MRKLLPIISILLLAPVWVCAQQYSGEVQFQVHAVDSDIPVTCSYAYNEEFVHLIWSDPSQDLLVETLVVLETRESYAIEGDSIKGYQLKRTTPERKSQQLFNTATPANKNKEIDGMKAELYYTHFGEDSINIWFTKEIDFDGKKYLPQEAIFDDFFAQMLNSEYGFPLQFSATNSQGIETNSSTAKWTRKSLPADYFDFTKSAKIEKHKVIDQIFETDDFDLMEPEPEPVQEEEEEIFMVVEEMPEFPGGKQAMIEFVYANIQYPEAAKKVGAEGQAVVRFVVQKDGNIGDVTIMRDPGHGFGEEAKRIIESMPQWTPGKQRGRAVNVFHTYPIRFKLPG